MLSNPAAGAPAGGGRRPPNPGRGGRAGRESGGGRKSRRTGGKGGKPPHKKRRTDQYSDRGRPLHPAERMLIFNIWSQLGPVSRRHLWTTLGGMLGETPIPDIASGVQNLEVAPPPPRENSEVTGPQQVVPAEGLVVVAGENSRLRAWERPIIRSIPLFQAYGQMSRQDRHTHGGHVNRLLSAAIAAIARARHVQAGISDQEILAELTPAVATLVVDNVRSLWSEDRLGASQPGNPGDVPPIDAPQDAGHDSVTLPGGNPGQNMEE